MLEIPGIMLLVWFYPTFSFVAHTVYTHAGGVVLSVSDGTVVRALKIEERDKWGNIGSPGVERRP
jgi:hypothetical protein